MKRRPNEDLLRVKLGIPQALFAEYLGVNRSQLAMYENGLRFLPGEASLKLASLEITHFNLRQQKPKSEKIKGSMHPDLQKHHDKIKKVMKAHLEDCKFIKLLYQRKLNKMIKQYEKAENCWHFLDMVSEGLPNAITDNPDHSWVNTQRAPTMEKIIRHGKASQAKLQAVIRQMEAGEALYTTLHDSL